MAVAAKGASEKRSDVVVAAVECGVTIGFVLKFVIALILFVISWVYCGFYRGHRRGRQDMYAELEALANQYSDSTQTPPIMFMRCGFNELVKAKIHNARYHEASGCKHVLINGSLRKDLIEVGCCTQCKMSLALEW